MMSNPVARFAPCHRLFFAARPPALLARQIAQSSLWFGPEARSIEPDRLHVTIDILNDFPAHPGREIDALLGIGGSVAAAPFFLELDRAVGSQRSVALRPGHSNPGLAALHEAIGRGMARAGLARREGYRFSPHMTLFYRDGRPSNRPIAPLGWQVEEFVLIRSLVGQHRHELLGRWALTGASEAQYSLL